MNRFWSIMILTVRASLCRMVRQVESIRTIPMKVSWSSLLMTSRGCEDWAPGHWDRLRSALWGGPNEWRQQASTIAKTQVIQHDMFWTDLIKWQWECMEIWIGTCSLLFFSGELEVKSQWWRYQCNAWLCRMKTIPVGPHWEVPSTVGWKTSSRWQRSWYRDCKIASKKHDTTWWYKKRHVIDIGEENHSAYKYRQMEIMHLHWCPAKFARENVEMTCLW